MEPNQPLVSIVIPAYNIEAYLDMCLRSVIEQDYKQLEILVVDDASTDQTLSIARHWATLDSRITVIEKPHEGLPMTRRRGLDASHGKYIQHLDGDDWLCSGAITALVARAEECGAEIVYAPFYYAYPSGEMKLSPEPDFELTAGRTHLKALIGATYLWTVWSHFCLREFYYACEVDVMPHINMCEDGILMTQLLVHDSRVAACRKPTIYYRQNQVSITNDAGRRKSRVQDMRAVFSWLENYIETNGLSSNYHREMAFRHGFFANNYVWHRDLSTLRSDMRRMAESEKQYPAIFKPYLTRHVERLLKSYCISPLLGDLRLAYYRWRKKI